MRIKITDRTELMMSQAVSLAQNGMMKSTITFKEKDLFIFNMDDTILIHFNTNQELPPASFFANDYESPDMDITNGLISFISKSGNYSRNKTCSVPKLTPDKSIEVWKQFNPDKSLPLTFNKSILSLLDDDLSHVEFHNQKGLRIVQKNIYSGARIEIENKADSSGLLGSSLPDSFQVVGIRTCDFKALFSFTENIIFFIQKDKNWVYFQDQFNNFEGILATCIYDEIQYLAEVK